MKTTNRVNRILHTISYIPLIGVCMAANANQIFTMKPSGAAYKMVAKHSAECVDVSKNSKADGQYLHQWQCLEPHAYNQTWKVRSLSNNEYKLIAQHRGKCLDMSADFKSRDVETLIQIICNSVVRSQAWRIESLQKVAHSSSENTSPSPRAMHDHIEWRNPKEAPSVPAGMHVSPYASNGMLPVVVHDGLRWWPMTNKDNAFLVNFVAFDQNNRLVKTMRFKGDRYVKNIKDRPNGILHIHSQNGTMVFHRSDLNKGGELYPLEFHTPRLPFPSSFLRGQVVHQQTETAPTNTNTGGTTSTGNGQRIILAVAGRQVEAGTLQYAEGGSKGKGKWIFTAKPGSSVSLPKELNITRKRANKYEVFGSNAQGKKVFYDILLDKKQIKNVSNRDKVEFTILRIE